MATINQDSFINLTEAYLPRYRKGEFKHLLLNKRNKSSPVGPEKPSKVELDQSILHNFRSLSGYINNLDELFKARMTIHEEEIIQIAHSQIKKIQQESQNIIKMYSDLIRAKNINAEILDLKYEVKYYQKRACEMFEENKQLKQQIKVLQSEIDIIKFEEESSHLALRNVSKKYLKEKTLRKNIEFGGVRRMLVQEPSPSNIKISLLSQSDYSLNPEKIDFASNLILSPTAHDSSLPRKQAVFSLKRSRPQVKPIVRKGLHERTKTEPARQNLPTIHQK